MHAFMRIAAVATALSASCWFAANAAEPADAKVPDRIHIIVSPFEGHAAILSGERLLAIGELSMEAMRPARPQPYMRCDPRFGCIPVHGFSHGQPALYGPDAMLAGPDLRLAGFGRPVLPVAARDRAYDPLRDHWRILFEATGKLDTNPAPLVSTAELLRPLAEIDPITTASIEPGPIRVEIVRRSDRRQTADIQELLNKLGHEAGPADGVAGAQTRAAILRFQQSRGIEATGVLSPALTDAIYRAAQAERPASGRLTAWRGDRKVLETDIDVERPETRLGTHVFMFSGRTKDDAPQWRLLTLSKRNSELAPAVFGFSAKVLHEKAAAETLARISLAPEKAALLGQICANGSVMVVADEAAPRREERAYYGNPYWR